MTGGGLCVKPKIPAYLTSTIKSSKKFGNINPSEKLEWAVAQKWAHGLLSDLVFGLQERILLVECTACIFLVMYVFISWMA
jgi:hypothetical protein